MKQLHILIRQLPVWLLVCSILSCSKQPTVRSTASLTLINAVPNSTPYLVTNFNGTTGPLTEYSKALKLTYGVSTTTNHTGAYSGVQNLAIYHYPDTLAHSAPLFNLTLDLQPGSIHTLFLTGTLADPDTLFTTDILPFHPQPDSTMGIRFVNLMPGSSPVSVNIAGSANGSEVSSLPYKSITGFTKYQATATAPASYNFEFRDAATGDLIKSINITGINTIVSTNTKRYRNFTVALLGIPGEPATIKTMLIDATLSL